MASTVAPSVADLWMLWHSKTAADDDCFFYFISTAIVHPKASRRLLRGASEDWLLWLTCSQNTITKSLSGLATFIGPSL